MILRVPFPLLSARMRLIISNSRTDSTSWSTDLIDCCRIRFWLDTRHTRGKARSVQLECHDPYFRYFDLAHGGQAAGCQDESGRA